MDEFYLVTITRVSYRNGGHEISLYMTKTLEAAYAYGKDSNNKDSDTEDSDNEDSDNEDSDNEDSDNEDSDTEDNYTYFNVEKVSLNSKYDCFFSTSFNC